MSRKSVKDYPESIERSPLQLNNKLKQAVNYAARQMESCDKHHYNPIESLNAEDIGYLQAYLEQIKVAKINAGAQPTNLKYCMAIGDSVAKNNAIREYVTRIPINPNSNICNYGEPTPRDVQPALPGPPTDYIPLGATGYSPCGLESNRPSSKDQMEFRNGFGPGSGIQHKLIAKPPAKSCSETEIDPRRFSGSPRLPPQQNIQPNQQSAIPRNRMTDIYDPVNRGVPEPGSRGATATRSGRKIANEPNSRVENFDSCDWMKDFHNPYSYGAKQNELGSVYKPTYTGPYNNNPDLLTEMGLSDSLYWEKFPGDIRNVNLESSLLQREMTHVPGQRELTEKEINRFELLPYDPQDTRHIVWTDNMPRNGYPTRVDRLETY